MTEMKKNPVKGDVVTYVDRVGRRQPALVTNVFDHVTADGIGPYPTVNLVLILQDANREDSYGRQIEHETSIVHKTNTTAPGFYWE